MRESHVIERECKTAVDGWSWLAEIVPAWVADGWELESLRVSPLLVSVRADVRFVRKVNA